MSHIAFSLTDSRLQSRGRGLITFGQVHASDDEDCFPNNLVVRAQPPLSTSTMRASNRCASSDPIRTAKTINWRFKSPDTATLLLPFGRPGPRLLSVEMLALGGCGRRFAVERAV